MTRRGFFATVAGLFAGAKIAEAAPAQSYIESKFKAKFDVSEAYFGGRTELFSFQDETRMKFVHKYTINSMYGKFGVGG